MADLDKYSVKDATHYLQCRHCLGRAVSNYRMKCLLLKKLPKRRAKVIVFGERNWRNKDHIKKIRYVPLYKLSPISTTNEDR